MPLCMSIFTVFCSAMDSVKHPTQVTENLMQALYSSIVNYKYEETRDLITKYPLLVDTRGSYKYQNVFCENITPAHLAAWQGNSVALEQLFAVSKNSVNAVTKEGNMPLHLASNERVADLLLKNGAHPNKWNKRKCTPLYAALYGVSLYEHKPYFDVAYCLLKNGADINYGCRFGATILHKATSGNMNSEFAQFLLHSGADGDVKNNMGETPFDQVIEQAVQRETFQRFGYCYYWVQHHSSDPFELFKQDPETFFLEKNTIWDIMRDLYTTAQQQEKKRQPMSKSDAIVIKVSKNAKLYIFKRASFADLEMYFGKQAIDSLRAYFENLYFKDMNGIKENARNPLYTIDDTDNHGNSLLHTAVQCQKSEIIKFLIDDKPIDWALCNNENKLADDYLTHDDCKAAFFDTLIGGFFARKLDSKHEEFVFNRLFYSDYISDLGRLHYFLMTLRNYPEKSWFFLHKGIDVNGQHKGTSPLAYAVGPWLKISWRAIPAVHKYNIRALLQRGAKVTKNLIGRSHGYMKRLLRKAYDEQNQRPAEK